MNKYSKPRITISNKNCTCDICNKKIHKGDSVYINPGSIVAHPKCMNDDKQI